ncbi:hypothetical protein [Aquabacterium humicola]|uniref:hypothetical protein n=1 Tax=Aquabacterium humicola TaxID=3237377 RepID=UPI0025427A28|nr:hypothetical protein [Rubrivivax pictus]
MCTEWTTGLEAWAEFVANHPELGYRRDHWAFHNFLRHFKQALIDHDAIRFAKRRFWVAHRDRFTSVAFACATGVEATDKGTVS